MRKPNLTDDYLIRIISQAIAAITRILGLKSTGQYLDAFQEVNLTLESLLGIPWELIQNFTDDKLVEALMRGSNLDVDRAWLTARLFHLEGDLFLERENPKAQLSYQRGLLLYLEVVLSQGKKEYSRPVEEIETVRKLVDRENLSEEMLFSLFAYHEQVGQYALADKVLDQMAELTGLAGEVQDIRTDFYRRLLDKTNDELSHEGLNRDEIQSRLDRD